ncbi:hypothetical protein COX08_02855 [Candidatus Beckwithbacteria bacterium CG23_combo_of_CG06-09_8_20_14_all_34_8]|uniref:Glycosyltransferase RgtA/B/C/D-like domain-containing protein n=1 Tax=Candidatus Beckwithbacteria bacterium CG23_combo_of_CG06-09_8_20_14_all_34_8 TaxID=1974497 RepID=A0A2H0B659_9BACT|nr:MAG: hypothetical protein COX08_02855 [Candidatus Beckwithbacteria bacterium CG23_combo_of_CG06-09_8_20_14_all_34_8]
MKLTKDIKIVERFFLQLLNYPYILIGIFIFIAYGNSLLNGIVYLDDDKLVVNQYQFNHNLANIPQVFAEDIFRNPNKTGYFYRPLLRLTFMADAQFGQEYVIFFSHFTNLIFHFLAISLFYYLLKQINIKQNFALLIVIIAGVHPLTAQTVAFIPGRNDSLLAVFIILSFIFFLRYTKNNMKKDYIFHILLFLFALLIKESAFVLPLIISFYILFFTEWKKIIFSKNYYFLLVGWIIMLLIWYILRKSVLISPTTNSDLNIIYSLTHNLPTIIPSIGKFILPFNLSVYPILNDMKWKYGWITIGIVLLISFFTPKKNFRLISFGFVWFILFFISSLIKPTYMTPDFLEHRLYLPMFGLFFVILGLNKVSFWDKLNKKNQNIFSFILITSIILVFLRITISRNIFYKNGVNFWENAVATSPSLAFNHGNLGTMFFLDGNYINAAKEFNKALEINPLEPIVHNNLGLIYLSQKQYDQAAEEFQKELEINPNYDTVYYNLGLVFSKIGETDKAIENWQKVLEINPNYIKAQEQLKILNNK